MEIDSPQNHLSEGEQPRTVDISSRLAMQEFSTSQEVPRIEVCQETALNVKKVDSLYWQVLVRPVLKDFLLDLK